MTVWIDADSCHRRAMQVLLNRSRGAEHAMIFVADRPITRLEGFPVQAVRLEPGDGRTDEYICHHAQPEDVAVTRDLELAGRLLELRLTVLNDRGVIWDPVRLARQTADARLMEAMARGNFSPARVASYTDGDAQRFAAALQRLL